MNPALQIALVGISALAAVLSGLTLFILSDMKGRLERLENLFFSRRGREVAEIIGEGVHHHA